MPTVREFFAREAGEYLDRLDRIVEGMNGGTVPGAELHRVARALRGSGQMARQESFARVASAMESAAREVAEARARWSPDLAGRFRQTTQDLRVFLRGDPDDAAGLTDAAVARFADVAGSGAPKGASPAATEGQTAFKEFAARESAAILGVVEAALRGVAADPMDREPLKAVLRRQRALMGAARLPSIPVLAETLTAIDEVTRIVARQDAAVTGEWLEVYRSAREMLSAVAGALQRGVEPAPGAALLRLRTLRQQLVERYGVDEPTRQPPVLTPEDEAAGTSAAHVRPPAENGGAARPAPRAPAPAATTSPARPAAPPAAASPASATEPVAIEEFLLRGERALARALELRPDLENAVAAGQPQARDLLAELFDLIELARA